jgi:hypothetical protein
MNRNGLTQNRLDACADNAGGGAVRTDADGELHSRNRIDGVSNARCDQRSREQIMK